LLKYYSIQEFFHAIPMHILLLCSNYLFIFIIEKTTQLKKGQTSLPLVSLSPRSSSSLLPVMVRMSLWCWSLF